MKIKVTYLKMFPRPERIVPPPREGLAVVHAEKPTVAYYRSLYDAVGRDYDWTSRKKLSDAERRSVCGGELASLRPQHGVVSGLGRRGRGVGASELEPVFN